MGTCKAYLLDQVLATVEANDVWIEDRNFCTLGFLFGIAKRQACFVVRQHQNLPWQAVTELEYAGESETWRCGSKRFGWTTPRPAKP